MPDTPKTFDDAIHALDNPEVRELDRELLFEQSPTGIALVHAQGYFLLVNQTFCDLVGYSSTELVRRRKYQDITHPEDVDAATAESDRLLSGESDAYRLLKRYLHKRGNAVWVQIQVTPARTKGGEFVHFVKHVSPIPMSEEFFRIEQSADGSAAIRPFYPLAKLIRENWKAVSTAATVLLGSLGTLGVNYLNMRDDTIQNQRIIENQKAQIDLLERRLDRLAKKTGVE